jgi:tetratricopeptide (TPR) repeat protein
MNRQIKKLILIIVSIILCVIFMGWVCYEFARVFMEREKAMQLPPYGSPARETYNKIWEKVSRENDQINKAFAFEKEGKLDLAIMEYKKALEMVKGGGYEFMVREELSICYEKTKQYGLSLDELNWLIDKKPRPEVLNELLARKENLQGLLKKK